LEATDHISPPYKRQKGISHAHWNTTYYVGSTGTVHHLQQQMALLLPLSPNNEFYSQTYIKQDNTVTLSATLM
jgi:hypothetical protein